MPNRRQHNGLGGFAAVLAYLIVKKTQNEVPNGGTLIASAVGGALVGGLPDDIEPAEGGDHRRTAHSWTSAVGVTYLSTQAWESPKFNNEQKAFLIAMGAAYISHLLADSDTPAGLPLFE
jgi:hypothetical protein